MTELLLRTFVKDHQNSDDPGVRSACGKLAGIVGIVCNILLFAGKLIIGTLSGSVSISADAVNNLSDASSSVVTLFGFKLASKPADDEHPFGHSRIEYFSGLTVEGRKSGAVSLLERCLRDQLFRKVIVKIVCFQGYFFFLSKSRTLYLISTAFAT